MKAIPALALVLLAQPVLADSLPATFQAMSGAWMHGQYSYTATPITFTGGTANIQLNWTGANGKAFSFTGSFTVGVSPTTLNGSLSAPNFNFSGGKVHVDALLKGTFTTTGFYEPLQYGLIVRGSPFSSMDYSFDYSFPCRVPAPPDTTLWKSQDLPASPGSINVPLSCDLAGLQATGTPNQIGGHAAFRMIFGQGNAEAMEFGAYVNFTYTYSPPVQVNLSVDRIEFVQTVQDEARDIMMVTGRPTVVRVFVNTHGQNVDNVNGLVRLSFGPDTALRVDQKPMNGPIRAPATWNRDHENDSLNFQLPDSWVAGGGTVDVEAEIVPPPGVVNSNSNYKATQRGLFYTWTRTFRLGYLLFTYQPPGQSTLQMPDPDVTDADYLVRRLYPVDASHFAYEPLPRPVRQWTKPMAVKEDNMEMLLALRTFYAKNHLENRYDQLVGWFEYLPPSSGGGTLYGKSDPSWYTDVDKDTGQVTKFGTGTGRISYARYAFNDAFPDVSHTLAHEMAHNFGLRHTGFLDSAGIWEDRPNDCKPTDPKYSTTLTGDPGFDASARQPVFKSAEKFDLMSYCSQPPFSIWISAHSYNALYQSGLLPYPQPSASTASSTKSPVAAAAAASTTLAPYFLVSGMVASGATSARIDPVYKVDAYDPGPSPSPSGAYCVRTLAGSATLAERCFDLSFNDTDLGDVAKQPFTALLPWQANATAVVVVYQNRELARATASAHAPTVQISSPAAGDSWNGGTRTVAWSAQDADGDTLTFTVFYSADNGASWLSIADDITDRSFTFDPSQILGGDQVKFRVMATDGFNTTTADAGPIHVVQRPALKPESNPLNARNALAGQSRVTGLELSNPGSGMLIVTAISSSDPAFQVVSPSLPFSIAAGAQRQIEVLFAPSTSGVVTAALTFTSNDATQPTQRVPITGTGLTTATPDAAVLPAALDFGSVTVGQNAALNVVLRNYGPGTLTLSSVTSSDAQFTTAGIATPLSLEAEDVTMAVAFSPTKTGAQSATLRIATNDSSHATLQMTLTGTGAAPPAAPPQPAINHGGVVEGAQFTGPVTPGGIASIYGAQLATGLLYAPSLPLPTNLGGTVVSVNGVNAPLYFVSAAQINFQVPFETPVGGSVNVVVTLNGVASAAEGVAVVSYAPAVFMNWPTHEPAVTRYPNNDVIAAANPAAPNDVLTIYVTGIGDLTNRPVTGAPTPASPLCSARLDPVITVGGTPVKFLWAGLAPTLVGLAQINVQLPADLAQGPSLPLVIRFGSAASQTVQLPVRVGTAAAPAISLSSPSLDFGSVTVGQTKDLAVTVRNTGTASLTVTGAASGNTSFTVTAPALPFTVAAGGQQSLTVRFAPRAAGAQSATLTIASNDTAHSGVTVALTGTGAGGSPQIDVTPTTLNFGTVSGTLVQPLMIHNSGTTVLTVRSAQFSNPQFAWYYPTSLPFTVNAGATTVASVSFTPTAMGAQSGTLTIFSDDPSRPTVSVSLSGTGGH